MVTGKKDPGDHPLTRGVREGQIGALPRDSYRSTDPVCAAIETEAVPRPLLQRLRAERTAKELEFATLYRELDRLDQAIIEIERLRAVNPGIEALIDSVR